METLQAVERFAQGIIHAKISGAATNLVMPITVTFGSGLMR